MNEANPPKTIQVNIPLKDFIKWDAKHKPALAKMYGNGKIYYMKTSSANGKVEIDPYMPQKIQDIVDWMNLNGLKGKVSIGKIGGSVKRNVPTTEQ